MPDPGIRSVAFLAVLAMALLVGWLSGDRRQIGQAPAAGPDRAHPLGRRGRDSGPVACRAGRRADRPGRRLGTGGRRQQQERADGRFVPGSASCRPTTPPDSEVRCAGRRRRAPVALISAQEAVAAIKSRHAGACGDGCTPLRITGGSLDHRPDRDEPRICNRADMGPHGGRHGGHRDASRPSSTRSPSSCLPGTPTTRRSASPSTRPA